MVYLVAALLLTLAITALVTVERRHRRRQGMVRRLNASIARAQEEHRRNRDWRDTWNHH